MVNPRKNSSRPIPPTSIHATKTVKEKIKKEEANEVKKKLEAEGAKVEIK